MGGVRLVPPFGTRFTKKPRCVPSNSGAALDATLELLYTKFSQGEAHAKGLASTLRQYADWTAYDGRSVYLDGRILPITVEGAIRCCTAICIGGERMHPHQVMSHLRSINRAAGYPDSILGGNELSVHAKRIQRYQVANGIAALPRDRRPLTLATIEQAARYVNFKSMEDVRTLTFMLVAVFGLFRSGKLTETPNTPFNPNLHVARKHVTFHETHTPFGYPPQNRHHGQRGNRSHPPLRRVHPVPHSMAVSLAQRVHARAVPRQPTFLPRLRPFQEGAGRA